MRTAARAVPAARRHWLLTLLLAAGIVLRALSQVAYQPALLYIDSLKYLYNAWPGTDPLGYKGVLEVILFFGNLQAVVSVQHLVGLAMGVAIYALLARRGVPRWLAAIAAAPVLLDGYELQMEQTIMPDVWFEALLVAGLVALLWQPRLTLRAIMIGGAAFGLSATVWQGGEFLIVPAVIYAVIGFAIAGWRSRLRAAVVMCVAFAVPILLYMTGSLVFSGHFWLSRSGTSTLYGRVAEAADCTTLRVPSYERVLCPTAAEKKLGPDGLDHASSSPLSSYTVPTGVNQSAAVSNFVQSVIFQQPGLVLKAYGADAARLYEVHRVTSPGDTPIWRWQFQTGYPSYQNYIRTNSAGQIILGLKVQNPPPDYIYQVLNPSLGGKAAVNKPLARFLRSYQLDGGFTPGPAYLAATVLGLIGTLSLIRLRSRRSSSADNHSADNHSADIHSADIHSADNHTHAAQGRALALACCLFFLTPLFLLLLSDIPEFSWRYQLPAVVTLPPAGILAIAAITAHVRARAARRTPAPAPAHDVLTAADQAATAG